jgi:hypothetical protein
VATNQEDAAMGAIANLLSGVVGIIALVCWIMILIRMFQAGATGPAIASIVLIICGIGPLIAFVYGWMKIDELRARNIMYIWTACLIGGIVLSIGGGLLNNQLGL